MPHRDAVLRVQGGHVVEVLLNGVRVHAASTAATLTKRPAEMSFELGSEHMLPELTESSVYLHVRPAWPAVRAAGNSARTGMQLLQCSPICTVLHLRSSTRIRVCMGLCFAEGWGYKKHVKHLNRSAACHRCQSQRMGCRARRTSIARCAVVHICVC